MHSLRRLALRGLAFGDQGDHVGWKIDATVLAARRSTLPQKTTATAPRKAKHLQISSHHSVKKSEHSEPSFLFKPEECNPPHPHVHQSLSLNH